VAEVEVDTETGQVEVINYVAANDLGKAINPLMANGQLEGGALMGIGWALTENLIVRDGRIAYTNLLDYKIPTFADMVSVVPILVEAEDPKGPYGAKSLGEPAFNPVTAAVCNAIYNAVGVRVTRLPVLPETLLQAIRARDRGEEGR
jgi:xanthine dehydrogenase molybdenum-binding subunit